MHAVRQLLLSLMLSTVALAGAALLAPSVAAACSCAWYDVPSARQQATHVFEGVLVRVLPASGNTPERAEFHVDRVWKGTVTRVFAVQATVGLTMCPPHLEVGQRYILYTSGPADAPQVARCSRFAAGPSLVTERRELGAPLQTLTPRP